MSLPNLPDITPDISVTRQEAINLLLSSIAMEEIGLSHILNAEGEKLQHFLKQKNRSFCEYLTINRSVNDTLKTIVKSQLLLQLKLEEVNQIKEGPNHENCQSCCKQACNCYKPLGSQTSPCGKCPCKGKPFPTKKCSCTSKSHTCNNHDTSSSG
ncbi:hypothetical protein P4G85_31375 [Bacillus cereus]|uniref:Uncharacterized protein n=2 Tax=Bacillus cereus group TaxID=86661 RepID=A0A9W5KTU6_BACCE|nr:MULTISPECIES: hypothetical protein [Bacillus cereus group]MEB8733174.1 hypothetical protein [Bacillus cereus]EEM44201.1 hypothetical protein bthur0005_60920 [Bacillus thuringiensis serovar pakistani str. T13001]EJR69350.1 hypothetical protein IK5_04664 [Bacillus cereus VD154]KIU76246.1 Collagen alpha-5(VI) chain Collagen alpha-1(XXIX) chain [Bacillus thuringiensis Sbt003]MEB8752712.1 hypothetical protein [Bacillus cereus]